MKLSGIDFVLCLICVFLISLFLTLAFGTMWARAEEADEVHAFRPLRVVKADKLYCRKGPGKEYDICWWFSRGEMVHVVIDEDGHVVEKDGWVQVQQHGAPEGARPSGWVCSDYLY